MSLIVNVGMWFERFVIIVTSLHRDYLPSSWSMYTPTAVELLEFTGTLGFFFTAYFLFVRALPTVSIAEVKLVSSYAQPQPVGHDEDAHVGGGTDGLVPQPAAREEGAHV